MSDFHFLHPWFLVLLPLCLALFGWPLAAALLLLLAFALYRVLREESA
ncbi:hypothetical protein [Klebsiella michiganensis]